MKKNILQLICTLLTSVFLLSSCSTIFQGSKQKITIQSLTKGAKIYVNGEDVGKDNYQTRLNRNRNHAIVFKKEGFETKIVYLEKQTQVGFVVADVILAFTGWGIGFIIVDAATGSWHRFDKDTIVAELEKSN